MINVCIIIINAIIMFDMLFSLYYSLRGKYHCHFYRRKLRPRLRSEITQLCKHQSLERFKHQNTRYSRVLLSPSQSEGNLIPSEELSNYSSVLWLCCGFNLKLKCGNTPLSLSSIYLWYWHYILVYLDHFETQEFQSVY